MVDSNLRLVVAVANKNTSRLSVVEDFADLLQDGNLGLRHAVDLFDWRKGYKFSTYATTWIFQFMTRMSDRNRHLMRFPIHAQNDLLTMFRKRDALTIKLGHEPTDEELCKALGWDKKKFTRVQQSTTVAWVTSLDQLLDGGDEDWESLVADPNMEGVPSVVEIPKFKEQHPAW